MELNKVAWCLCLLFTASSCFAQAAAVSPVSFATAVSFSSKGWAPDSVAVADLNSDGKPDLVVANRWNDSSNRTNGTVAVLLGNGGGTFQPAVTYSTGGGDAESVVVADLNGDSKPDLIVGNNNAGVGVLLGNGDGTFQTAVAYGSGGFGPFRLGVADVNGDGRPDVVAPNQCGNIACEYGSVGVLLGNGGGSFQAAVAYSSGGYDALSVAVADVNGDGKRDIVVANCGSSSNSNCENGTVAVLLGNGDGTFQSAVAYSSGGYDANSVAVADLNADGKPDLVVANEFACSACTNAVLGVLLSNGNGTFQTEVPYNTGGGWAFGVTVADLNGDGKPDLVVANLSQSTVGMLLGSGDGTFQPAVTYDSGGGATASVAVADVNGDGKPDVLVTNECASRDNCNNGSVSVLINTTPVPYEASVQQPIDAAGTSIFSAKRKIVPVKFTLTKNDLPTCTLPPATITVTRAAGTTSGSVDASTYSTSTDSGPNFRIDSTACHYIYNLATSSLGVGTYRVDISIDGIVVGHAVFALR